MTSKKEVLVCGVTSHLSTFALLLTITTDTSCADDTFFWIAIGLIIAACLVCLVAIAINEVVMHQRKKRLEATLTVCFSFHFELLFSFHSSFQTGNHETRSSHNQD